MKLTPKQAIERADITLADLTANGGLLQPEQADRFIDFIYAAPTLINGVRQIKMGSHTTKIPKIGFGDRILKPSPGSGQELASNDRSKPTTDEVEITTVEVVGEVRLPYEVLEDNLEEANLEETVMRNIATRSAVDLEELALQGDVNSADAYLALKDGWLKLANTNLVDAASGFVDEDMLESIILAVEPKYRRPLSDFRYYTHDKISRKWTRTMADRGTVLGDNALLNGGAVPYSGALMVPVDMMPETSNKSSILFTNPKNLIFGIWRQIRMEVERMPRARAWAIVISARIGMSIEEVNAISKAYDVKTQ